MVSIVPQNTHDMTLHLFQFCGALPSNCRNSLKNIRIVRLQTIFTCYAGLCFHHCLHKPWRRPTSLADKIYAANSVHIENKALSMLTGHRITNLFKLCLDFFHSMSKLFSHCSIQPTIHIIPSGMLSLTGRKYKSDRFRKNIFLVVVIYCDFLK